MTVKTHKKTLDIGDAFYLATMPIILHHRKKPNYELGLTLELTLTINEKFNPNNYFYHRPEIQSSTNVSHAVSILERIHPELDCSHVHNAALSIFKFCLFHFTESDLTKLAPLYPKEVELTRTIRSERQQAAAARHPATARQTPKTPALKAKS